MGGEQSGHIIFKDISPTGDGLISTFKFLEAVIDSNYNIDDIYKVIPQYPQLLENVRVKNKKEIVIKYRNRNREESERKIKPVEIINKNGRMFVRAFCYTRKEEREFRLDRIIKIVDNVKEG